MNMWTRYHGPMNITFALDDALIAAAKVVAAKQDTTVTALVRQSLEQQVALDGELAASASTGVLQVLLDYSMGRVPRTAALESLGTHDYGVLLRLLNAAGLPHPLVPLTKRRAMAAGMAKLLAAAGTSR